MARTLVGLYVHIVFSAKNRADSIPPEIELELFAYAGGILKKCEQSGCGAFSLGETQVDDVKRYIAGQKEKHRTPKFEDELPGFPVKYQMPFDEKYLWKRIDKPFRIELVCPIIPQVWQPAAIKEKGFAFQGAFGYI